MQDRGFDEAIMCAELCRDGEIVDPAPSELVDGADGTETMLDHEVHHGCIVSKGWLSRFEMLGKVHIDFGCEPGLQAPKPRDGNLAEEARSPSECKEEPIQQMVEAINVWSMLDQAQVAQGDCRSRVSK